MIWKFRDYFLEQRVRNPVLPLPREVDSLKYERMDFRIWQDCLCDNNRGKACQNNMYDDPPAHVFFSLSPENAIARVTQTGHDVTP